MQLSSIYVSQLLDLKHRGYLRRGVREKAELILRNLDRMERDELHLTSGLQGFVANSMHLLVAAGRLHRAWALQALSAPGLQDFLELGKTDGSYWTYYRTSEAPEEDLAKARSTDSPVLVWVEDRGLSRTRVLAQRPRFVDLANGHKH